MSARPPWTILAIAVGPPSAAAAPTPTAATTARALTIAATAPLPALSPLIAAVTVPAVSAVSLSAFAIPAASAAPPAPTAAATLATRAVLVGTAAPGRRRLACRRCCRLAAGRHALDPRPEIGIDLHDTDARHVGGRRPGATRAAPETRAAHRHAAGIGRLLGVGRRRGGGSRLRRLVFFLFLLCRSRVAHRLGRRRLVRRFLRADAHRIGPLIVTRQIDQLGVVRLA